MTKYINDTDVILCSGEKEEFLSREEYVAAYGDVNDAVTTVEMETVDVAETVEPPSDVDRYWQAFLDLTYVVGKFAAVNKLAANASEGVYPVTRVVHYYYKHNPAYVECDAERWYRKCYEAVDTFDTISRDVGYKPMSKQDRVNLLNFLYVAHQRQYCRRNAQRMQKKQEMISVKELVAKCYAVQHKRASK